MPYSPAVSLKTCVDKYFGLIYNENLSSMEVMLMLAKTSLMLAVVYVPLMWSLALTLFMFGLVGVSAPGRLRSFSTIFTRNGPVRALGALLLVLGAEMFIQAPNTSLPWLVKTLSVILFIDGGVRLFLPTLSVIITERLSTQRATLMRLFGLLFLAASWLFYLATKLPPHPPAA